MTGSETTTWQRQRQELERLRDLPAAEQQSRLTALAQQEPDLAAELRDLLAADAAGQLPIDRDACSLHAEGLLREESEELIGREVAGYRLTEWLGIGGTATVFRGESASGPDVAVKILRTGTDSEAVVARFRQERAITSGFEHRGLVRVLGAGELAKGRPYLLTEFVDGKPIDEYCEEHELDHRARLALFLEVCRAVHHAHRHLVVHRDLKPSNILVETSSGKPRVLDFGIAKLLDDERDPGWTEVYGRSPMTPSYASPEQIRGEPVTTASDVYSLGVLLYRLLVGRSPYRPGTQDRTALERAVVFEPPRPPSEAGERTLPRDLATILAHCLQKASDDRYPSAEHLADDVQRFLEHRPLRARRESWHVGLRKFVRRRPLLAAGLAAVFALILGGWVGARHNLEAVRKSESVAWRAHANAAHATNTLADVLEGIAAHGDPSPDDLRTQLAVAERHADTLEDSPEAEARLRIALAKAQQRLGLGDRSESNARRALHLSRDTRGLTWRETDRCLALLIELLAPQQGAEALTFATERVELLRRHRGNDAPETLAAENVLKQLRRPSDPPR